jgi:hypothetical protein
MRKTKEEEMETVAVSSRSSVFDEAAAKPLHAEVDRAVAVLASVDLVELGRKLHEMVSVDVRTSSAADGFPKSVPGASPSTRPAPTPEPCVDPKTRRWRHELGEVCDECTPVMLNPVERAVSARAGRDLDEYHRKLEAALGYLSDAANALRGAINKLADVDRIRDTAGLQPGDPGCWALERIGAWEPVLHRVVVDGVERPLGTWAYGFYRRNGRVPNRHECKDHVANPSGKVKVR